MPRGFLAIVVWTTDIFEKKLRIKQKSTTHLKQSCGFHFDPHFPSKYFSKKLKITKIGRLLLGAAGMNGLTSLLFVNVSSATGRLRYFLGARFTYNCRMFEISLLFAIFM